MQEPEEDVPKARAPKWVPIGLASIVNQADRPSSLLQDGSQELDAPLPVRHAPSVDLAIGQVFGGKYRVLDRLGAGGMAVVYRAQEQGLLKRDVALKVLTPESALSQATIARFLKEAQAISDIRHPNVVQLIELGRTDEGQIYLVMERLIGKTLLEVLREMAVNGEVFSWDRLAPIILQICRALHAAHKQKIIHRDMKPSNCFCCEVEDEQWHVKVLDFGIAKVQSGGTSDDSVETPLTQEGMFLGTPHYAAPEIVNRRPEHVLDGRVDIFALGVMMYQCLTGTLPFQEFRSSRVTVMYKTAHERPESPRRRAPGRDIPPEVDALVMRAMEIEVESRFATVTELAEAIRASLRPLDSTPGGGGMVRGSILESTPSATVNIHLEETSTRELAARGLPDELGTPIPPGDGSPPTPTPRIVDSPTSIQNIGSRASMLALGILVAMVLGLVVLLALIVMEASATRTPAEGPAKPPAAGAPSSASPRAVPAPD